ncbi:hypothetical protein [Nitrosomonas aestuarii]|uniref:hypothetical protein n=1 Tax=Nitrosomonas aestuarii TaxID=52441 RepID=UPI000D3157AE|nr:hypothetical protein [Nitrosomonas aestuarii]PTN11811.1 hypothetical protein C8R11_10796 [Nitrosomonas aestuarii]
MKCRYISTSLTRISNLDACDFEVNALPREQWETGDYVVGRVLNTSGCLRHIELPNGRMAEVSEDDLLIGAFGQRAATLEAVGDWRDIAPDNRFDIMTSAGLFGKITSRSTYLPQAMSLAYQGHVMVAEKKSCMANYVRPAITETFDIPVILLIGTSMSAGKTTSARVIIRLLKQSGYKVAGAKLTGAGRYRDALSLADAGADHIFDFMDIGLPSTVCDPDQFRPLLRQLMYRIDDTKADVLVAEAGASPLEPYNGSVAVEELEPWVRCTVLCASDPYAVAGVIAAFASKPDIIAGGAANTSAGIALVEKLTHLKAMNLQNKNSIPELKKILSRCLGFNL